MKLRLPLLIALLALAGGATAQLKPSGPGTPPLPPSVPVEAQGIKELAAQATAETWLKLLDEGDYAKAWDACAKLFRERVSRQQWIESLPVTRKPFGALKSRLAEVASYRTTLPGAPAGEYVTVRFSSRFEKRDDVEEMITLTYEGGAWRPTGYSIR